MNEGENCPHCGKPMVGDPKSCPVCESTVAEPGQETVAASSTEYRGELHAGLQLAGGRFLLIRKLGEGGMGAVWQAVDRQLSEDDALEQVALKFIGGGLAQDPLGIALLRKEVRASLQLTHPHIVRVRSWHEYPGEPVFYSMEYVEGQDLKQFVASQPHGRLTCAELQPILDPLLDALEYAHTTAGMVHRDLKPANVMLAAKGEVKLADFGLARPSARDQFGATTPGGTPGYSSPQQRRGEAQRVSDDLYSLGAMLYHVLTGELPYSMDVIRSGEPLPRLRDPRRVLKGKAGAGRKDITAEAAFTLMRCLDEDPARRPPDIATFRRWWKYGADPNSDEARSGDVWWRTVQQAVLIPVLLATPLLALGALTWDRFLGNWVEGVAPGWAWQGDAWMDRLEARLGTGREGPFIARTEILNDEALLRSVAGITPTNRAAAELRRLFVTDLQSRLVALQSRTNVDPTLVMDIVANLNRTIQDHSIWDECGFTNLVNPGDELWSHADKRPRRYDRRSLNNDLIRWALAGAFDAPPPTNPPLSLTNLTLVTKSVPRGSKVHVDIYRGEESAQNRAIPVLTTNWVPSSEPLRVSGVGTGAHRLEAWCIRGGTNVGWISESFELSTNSIEETLDFTERVLQIFATNQVNLKVVDQWTNVIATKPTFTEYPNRRVWRIDFPGTADGNLRVLPGKYRIEIDPQTESNFDDLHGSNEVLVPPSPTNRGGKPIEVTVKPTKSKLPRLDRPWSNSTILGVPFLAVAGNPPFLGAKTETPNKAFQAFVKATNRDMGALESITADGSKDIGRSWREPFGPKEGGENHPVVGVSWDDAVAFCQWLTQRDQERNVLTRSWRYKLPTSEEWDRMVGKLPYPWGRAFPPTLEQGNYARPELLNRNYSANWPSAWHTLMDNYTKESQYAPDGFPFTCPVDSGGRGEPSLPFLHLGGNVAEWCDSWYRAPLGAANEARLHPRLKDDRGGQHYRVVRGGSWFDHLDPALLRTDSVWAEPPSTRNDRIGFRIILVNDGQP